MSDVTEGIGAAIEGALAGRAVEPKHGEAVAGDEAGGACLNCGAEPKGTYCQNCGQKRHVHRTLSAIGHDLIHGVLHLDGKFWRTLPLLVFKPGKLTRRYIEGERAKFVSPMAMFLFSVFAMFAVFQMVGLTAPTDLASSARTEVEKLVAAEKEEVTTQLSEVRARLDDPELPEAERASLDQQRVSLEEDLALLESRGEGITALLTSNLERRGEANIADAKRRLETLPEGSEERADLEAEIETAEAGLEELQRYKDGAIAIVPLDEDGSARMTIEKSGIPVIDDTLAKWRENPSLMIYKMQANGYKFSWLLIPLSIPFVWLMFAWKRRFKAYDHAVFVTYSLSFMSLFLIALSLLGFIGLPGTLIFLLFATIAPLHLYKHLRRAYEISRLSAVWRFTALFVFIFVVLVLFLQALLLLGAF